jgi:sugar lactone lactonase YvrE
MKNSVRLALCALVCLIFGSVSVDAQNITTVIGGGPFGLAPTAASLGSPVALRLDAAGNAFILDNTYGRVLRVDHTTGLVSVFAGNGTVGFSGDGGPATNAQMNGPSGMCLDASGNVFIADSDNAVIREVAVVTAGGKTAGDIYTVVGVPTSTNPIYGGDGGAATAANLHFPDGCSFDTHGNLYIADRGNNEIRVVIGTAAVTPPGLTGPLTAGNIYRFAGGTNGAAPNPPTGGYAADGSAAATGQIYGPFDVFVDANNNVFIADLGNNFGPDGTPDTQAGQPPNNNVVREVLATDGTIHTVAGVVTLVAGVPTGQYPPSTGAVASGTATTVALNEPKGLSVDSTGNLYFCDTVSQVIRKVAGGNISVVAGTLGQGGYSGDGHAATSATLTFPAGTFVDATGDLFISDDGSNALRIVPLLSNDGSYLLNNIYTFAGNGHLSFSNDGAGATATELNTPAGLALDPMGDILVADSGNDLVRVLVKSAGTMATAAGQTEANGFSNDTIGPNDFGVLNAAVGIATDSANNVYIADTANCIVRKRTTTGIATIAGFEPPIVNPDNPLANVPKCGFDAQGAAAVGTHIGKVSSVAVDSHGNVFFSDTTNSVIWEIPATTAGTLLANHLYIVAGSTTAGFAGDGGPANAAQLSGPTGIYLDIYNNLFIADAGNRRIREVPAINFGTTMTAGSIYTIAGNGTSGNTGDGAAATAAELATPFAIVVDNAENVFLSDTTNQTIREIAGATGHITTVAGTKNVAGFGGDGGAALSAHFNVPEGLALQANASPSTTANLLVSDSVNNRVRSVAGIANVAPVAIVSLSPNPLVFTAQSVGTASTPPLVITLTNTGGAALTVNADGVTIAGTNAGDYSETDNCSGTTVNPAATCTINVTFKPGAVGASTATLTVADSALGGSQTVTLNGTGGTPMATLTPKSLTFPSAVAGTAAPTQTITLANGGNVATIVTGITITGTNAADYSETDNCVGVTGVAPAASCTITVTFKPAATEAAGMSAATLNIADNVPGSPQTVMLSGTVGAATLTLKVTDTDTSSTQTVTAGSTATYNLSVSGNQSVTATITCAGAPTAATCSPTPGSVAVTPTAAGTFKVSVTTTARSEMLPFNQPSMKMQPPSMMQVLPMVSLALLFIVVMMFGWMQNQAGRARLVRVALSLALILMPIAAATMLVGCGGGSSSTPPPPVTGTPVGTYTLMVTATSGSTTSPAVSLTLVVN